MGADFKEKTRKSFEKCWDRAAVEANTPDLFRKAADLAPRRFEAEAINGLSLAVGDSVCVRLEDGKIIGRRGLSAALTITTPPPDLVMSITQSCNVARAEIVAIDPISDIYEVTVR